jgi:hypothetical protein
MIDFLSGSWQIHRRIEQRRQVADESLGGRAVAFLQAPPAAHRREMGSGFGHCSVAMLKL